MRRGIFGDSRLPAPRTGAAVLVVILLTLFAAFNTQRLPLKGDGYWHTSGTRILDDRNRPVRIAALTWYGGEYTTWVPGGLDFQPYRAIMREIKRLGYNTIRLPFSNELVERNPRVTGWVAANPEFRGRHALAVLRAIAVYAGKIGLKIILDDQTSSAEPIYPAPGRLDEPLWYTRRYPQSHWIRDWERLARMFLENPAVIGFDLRNEPHTAGPGQRGCGSCGWGLHAYLHQGATWGPFEGHHNIATDWRRAAERAGDAVLRINPRLLIFVEGLQLYPQRDQPNGVDSYWYGGILTMVRRYPVVLSVPHRLVYSPHGYGPEKWPYYPLWRRLSYATLSRVLNAQWGFILNHPHASYAAPIFVGETGTCTGPGFCGNALSEHLSRRWYSKIGTLQAKWLRLFVRYLRKHPKVGWGVWGLNGTNARDFPTTDGLLNAHWNGVQSRQLQNLLKTVE